MEIVNKWGEISKRSGGLPCTHFEISVLIFYKIAFPLYEIIVHINDKLRSEASN